MISNVRESMVSVERLLLFLSAAMPRPQRALGFQAEWRTALRDVQSIEEHATFLSSKVQFLLDATLGLVTIEQNDIIKLFSVMSVVFLPPTLRRVDLRHELQAHAGARLAPRLSFGDRADDRLGGAAVPVLPVEAVAVGRSAATAGSDAPIR